MSSKDPARIVQDGYDLLDGTYRNWVATMHEGPRRSFLARVLERIPPGCDVLEVGCGPGTDAVALSAGFDIRSSETVEEIEPGEGPSPSDG